MIRPVRRPALLAALALLAPAVSAGEAKTAKFAGTVTDEAGKPLAGATVLVNRTQGAAVGGHGFPPPARTGKDGRYELSLQFQAPGQVRIQLWAYADGYVRAEDERSIDLKDGGTFPLDFKLTRGEPLAGVIRLPWTAMEPRPERQFLVLDVVGPKFRQTHLTEKGGRFRLFVPPGEYTIRFYRGFDKVEWTGLKAGSTDLVWQAKPFVWSEENVGQAFDRFWETMDRDYSYFFLKNDVDWQALKDRYRPRAVKAKSAAELVEVLREMLLPLKDLHVWIETADGPVAVFRSSYQPNWNRKATLALLEEKTACGKFAVVGKTRGDGFGYFLMVRQSEADEASVKQAVAAIRKLHDAPGFVVDLRAANGGDETKAQQIARLFCGRRDVYARSKFRTGGDHDDFSKNYPRWLERDEDPYLRPVVCLIGPGAVSSGEGFVQMMRCLPHVTTVGLPTRGASGNPHPYELAGTGVAVWFSRWVDMLPDATPFEGTGIAPAVEVRQPAAAYAERDPTLEKGLEVLRRKVAR
jgi:hypothetical protein